MVVADTVLNWVADASNSFPVGVQINESPVGTVGTFQWDVRIPWDQGWCTLTPPSPFRNTPMDETSGEGARPGGGRGC